MESTLACARVFAICSFCFSALTEHHSAADLRRGWDLTDQLVRSSVKQMREGTEQTGTTDPRAKWDGWLGMQPPTQKSLDNF